MAEESQIQPKETANRLRRWHLWFLVILSLFLIVTFVYYLPTRFLYLAAQDAHEHEHMMEDMDEHMDEHAHEDNSAMPEKSMAPSEDMHGQEEMMQHPEEEHGQTLYREEKQTKEGLAVNMNFLPVPVRTGRFTQFDFFVNQKPGNVPVLAESLQVEHEKLMHVIGVRSDMNEFFHVHPDVDGSRNGFLSVVHLFKQPGKYKIWSEIKKDGTFYSFGHEPFDVGGDGITEDKKVSFSRVQNADQFTVSMQFTQSPVQKKDFVMSFDIHTNNGQETEIENYLGAQMHLAIIKDDWSQFIHTHPEGGGHEHGFNFIQPVYAHGDVPDDRAEEMGGEQHGINFNVNFPTAGLYKVFAQFRPKGSNLPPDQALLASYWIRVEEKAPLPISSWWLLLFVSLIAIAILSWATKKFLKVNV